MKKRWWIGAAIFVSILFGLGVYFYWRMHFKSEDLAAILKNDENLRSLRFSELHITKEEYSYKKWAMEFEAIAKNVSLPNRPALVKDLKIWGEYKPGRGFELKKMIGRIDEDIHVDGLSLRGGFLFELDGDNYALDLTDLGIESGFFQKKIGEAALIHWKKSLDPTLQAQLSYGNDIWPLRVETKDNQWKVTLAEENKKLFRAKLPLRWISEWNLSGELSENFQWIWDDREVHSDLTIQTDELRFNLDDWKDAPLTNQRGLVKLSGTYHVQDSKIVEADFKMNLSECAFESSDHRYFKTEGQKAGLEASIEDNKLQAEINLGNAKALWTYPLNSGQDLKTIKVNTTVSHFPVELLPLSQKYQNALAGDVDGKIELQLERRGDFQFEVLKLSGNLNNAEMQWDPALLGSLPVIEYNFRARGHLKFESAQEEVTSLHFEGIGADNSGTKISLTMKGSDGNAKISFQEPQALKNFWGDFDVGVSGTLEFVREKKLWSQRHSDLQVQSMQSAVRHMEMTGGKVFYKDQHWTFEDAHFSLGENSKLRVTGEVSENPSAHATKENTLHVLLKADSHYLDTWEALAFLKNKISPASIHLQLDLQDEEHPLRLSARTHLSDTSWILDQIKIAGKAWQAQGQGEVAYDAYRLRDEDPTFATTFHVTGDLDALDVLNSQGAWSGEMQLATRGKNFLDWKKNLELRIMGDVHLRSGDFFTLLADPFQAFAKEKKELYAQALASCVPKNLQGKVDLEYRSGNWRLNPSLLASKSNAATFQGTGEYSDAEGLSLEAAYLPGAACSSSLARCLADGFPKGGVPMSITGKISDPEVEVDFEKLADVINHCGADEIDCKPSSVQKAPKNPAQNERVRELKDLYDERKKSS